MLPGFPEQFLSEFESGFMKPPSEPENLSYSYLTMSYQPLNCLIVYDLTTEQPVHIEHVPVISKVPIERVLREVVFRGKQLRMILFDDLVPVGMETCRIMTGFGMEFALFSTLNCLDPFELPKCALTNFDNLIFNRKGEYSQYFERIEVLQNPFRSYKFVVESKGFSNRFGINDHLQLDFRLTGLRKILKEFEGIPNVIQEYKEEIRKANRGGFQGVDDYIGLFQGFLKLRKAKNINCSFEYFLESYVLSSGGY